MIAALTIVSVAALGAPASAAEPIDGTVKMSSNPGSATGTGPCPEVTWAGSLEITDSEGQDGSYGLVLSTTDVPGVNRGEAYLFQEGYAVMTEPLSFDEEGALVACTAGEVILSGWDAGVGILPKGEFWDTGYVETASGPFDGWDHARTYQDGSFTEFIETEAGVPWPVGYEGTFRLVP
jgi:hypothetical protein